MRDVEVMAQGDDMYPPILRTTNTLYYLLCRECIRMRHIDRMKLREIACALELPVKAIREMLGTAYVRAYHGIVYGGDAGDDTGSGINDHIRAMAAEGVPMSLVTRLVARRPIHIADTYREGRARQIQPVAAS